MKSRQKANRLITLLILSTRTLSVPAFVLPTTPGARRIHITSSSSFTRQQEPLKLGIPLDSWGDIVFNAQSVARNLASTSLNDNNLFTSLSILYFAGLLTSLSPCVWGLLPLTMSYISTAAGERQDKATTLPTLAFAAGLAFVFCSLGVAAVKLGGVFGSSQSVLPILPVLSNAICLAMGLQLLDLVQLPLPSLDGLKPKKKTNEPILIDGTGKIIKEEQGGSLLRTFLLGGSSALVASPCATPVLTSILAYVATAQSSLLGAAFLFVYTMGYSTPLLLVASTGGQVLVKLKEQQDGESIYGKIAPWVTPMTAGILLWYGTTGMLTSLVGDPSLAGLPSILQ
jgi:cytochrome c-type biogenesis protein